MKRPSTFLRPLLIGLLFVTIGGNVFYARPTHAVLGVGDVVGVVTDIPRQIFQAIDKAQQKLAKVFKTTGDVAFKSSLEIFQARLLQEVQSQLATVGPGQKPLFLTNPKKFFKNVSNAAAGDYIDDFTRGVTGEPGVGTSFSGARGKFLISRLVRAQAGLSVDKAGGQCATNCRNNFSVGSAACKNDDEPGNVIDCSTLKASELPELVLNSTRNDHESKILQLSYFMYGPNGNVTQSKKESPDKSDFVCRGVSEGRTNGTAVTWIIDLEASYAEGAMTFAECKNHQDLAINNEKASAQTETNQCVANCQTAQNASNAAIDALTATDIFSAVKNADPRKAPSTLANALSSDKSDIGIFLSTAGAVTSVVQDAVTGEQTNLNPNIYPVTTKVSEEVKSPSTTASTLLGIPFVGSDGKFTYTGTSVADVLKGVLSFVNSPVGRALRNYFSSKCGLNPDLCKGPSNSRSTIGQLVFGNGSPTGTAGAQLLYATLGQTQIITGDPGRNEISVTDQLSSAGLIDSAFRQAIEEQLTVQEAIDKGFLDPEKTFGFDKNGIEPREGYPYRGLQYLRKYRITPVGWELAARYSQELDHRDLSLGYLISRYNICDQDPSPLVCSVGGAACSTPAETSACTATSVCSLGGASCVTAAEIQQCGLLGGTCVAKAAGTCVTKLPSGDHTVCTRGPKADQSCQQDSDCGLDENNATITCGASPYCGLVDPNWVLKAPQTYCRRQGAGEEILTKEFVCDVNNIDALTGDTIPNGVTCDPNGIDTCTDVAAPNCVASTTNPKPDIGRWVIERNSDTCADTQSCIAENEDGTCQAFGYCVQERQVYKFDGTQCSAENSSCTAYTSPVGQQVAYLANTLDSRNCNADNAGCTQYCAAPSYDPATQQCNGNDTINFTGKVASCDQSQAGCRQFLQTTNGTNLLVNSGFEISDQPVDGPNSANFSGWLKTGSIGTYPVSANDPSITANNGTAVRTTGVAADTIGQSVLTGHELYERTFTLSIRAKADATCNATLKLEADVPASDARYANRPFVPSNDLPNMAVTAEWDTYDVTLAVGSTGLTSLDGIYGLKASVRLNDCATHSLVIDSAQLEETSGPTQYKDYGTVNAVYLNGQRQSCTVADVGCQSYAPLSGGTTVFGQVRNSNRCSSDSVGCASYRLEPIQSVPQRTGGQVNVVAPKGQICTAADVGCEEYTNLDEVAKGGEGKAYYTSVKQCVKPSQLGTNPRSATYYTWVGDAKLGYVLRAYDLVQSTTDTGGATDGGPCMNLTVGTVSDTPRCADTTGATGTIASASCLASDLGKNPDCAQFYDSALTVYYRLRSRTITITENCTPYRNTIDQSISGRENLVYYLSTSENVSCNAAAAGCRAYTGNASGTTRKVFTDTFESGSTSNWLGGELSNASVNLNGHSMLIPLAGTSPAAVTRDTVLKNQIFGGRTYLLTFNAAASTDAGSTVTAFFGRVNGTTVDPFGPETNFPGSVNPTWNSLITPSGPEWHQFSLGPLTVPQDLANAQLAISIAGGPAYIDNVELTEVNDHIYMVSSSLPQCQPEEVGCAAYRDGNGTTNYLTSFSRLCSEKVVGCEAMIDTQNSVSPFAQTIKGVTTLADTVVTVVNNRANYCAAASKGCEAFGKPTYGPDQQLLSYSTQYLINNPDRYSADLCLDTELSCQVYTTAEGTAAYFKDPGQGVCEYRTGGDGNGKWTIVGTSQPCPIVMPPAVGRPVGPSCSPVCAAGSRQGRACTSDGDCPGSSCVGNAATIGMVRDGSGGAVLGQCTDSNDCASACVGGPNDGQLCSNDSQCGAGSLGCKANSCVYLAGSCPAEQNGCTEYRDPSDPVNCRAECPLSLSQGGSPDFVDGSCQPTRCAAGLRRGQNCQTDEDCFDGSVQNCVDTSGQPTTGIPGCRPYYYIRQSIETNAGACNGKIDPAIGCRPFNDTTNPNLNFRGQ